ncbi:MAG: hypothetical protein ACLUI3_08940 [Christensenellales bacterium]
MLARCCWSFRRDGLVLVPHYLDCTKYVQMGEARRGEHPCGCMSWSDPSTRRRPPVARLHVTGKSGRFRWSIGHNVVAAISACPRSSRSFHVRHETYAEPSDYSFIQRRRGQPDDQVVGDQRTSENGSMAERHSFPAGHLGAFRTLIVAVCCALAGTIGLLAAASAKPAQQWATYVNNRRFRI